MHDTLIRELDTDLVPNSATLHIPNPVAAMCAAFSVQRSGGEGGIVSTVDDMLKWLRAYVGAGRRLP